MLQTGAKNYLSEINFGVRCNLKRAHTPLRAYGQDACCKDRMQAGAHEADIGSFLYCSRNSLQEQCTPCDTEK